MLLDAVEIGGNHLKLQAGTSRVEDEYVHKYEFFLLRQTASRQTLSSDFSGSEDFEDRNS